jgi:hypothetical protein
MCDLDNNKISGQHSALPCLDFVNTHETLLMTDLELEKALRFL